MGKTEKIISEFERFIQEYDRDIGFTSYDSEVLKGALALLKEQEPVMHGRWIDENPDDSLDPRMRCSICTRVESPLIKWRYCPNCGARMDEK